MALDLARKYSLDCDLVYQRQWRNTPVSVTSIQDYLVCIHSACLFSSQTETVVIVFRSWPFQHSNVFNCNLLGAGGNI